ncbi:protein of unknown function [Streptomyces sp. KY70]|nr:protein of unknown function [Streptomyces sp. KY70]
MGVRRPWHPGAALVGYSENRKTYPNPLLGVPSDLRGNSH